MSKGKLLGTAVRFAILLLAGLVTTLTIFRLRASEAGGPVPSLVATYAHGVLHVTIPYRGAETGSGQLTVEVLDPEDWAGPARSQGQCQRRPMERGDSAGEAAGVGGLGLASLALSL